MDVGGPRQSSLDEFGFNESKKKFKKAKPPIQSLCVSCGKVKWLTWVAGDSHVCDECKKYIEGKKRA